MAYALGIAENFARNNFFRKKNLCVLLKNVLDKVHF